MKEVTRYRFHDILYKFFISLSMFGIGMLAMDIITLLNKYPLYMFGQPMHGWETIYALIPPILLALGCYWIAQNHKKQSMEAKWR